MFAAWRLALPILASVVATPLMAGPSVADDGNWTGGDVCMSDCGQLSEDEQQSAARTQLDSLYYAALFEGGSFEAYLAEAEDYAATYGLSEELLLAEQTLAELALNPGGSPVVNTRTVDIEHVAQANNYYCGPASGVMILRALSAGRSAANGEPLDQGSVAGPVHMQANDGATEWASHRFRVGLNQWLRGSRTGYYSDKHDPSGTEFRNAVVHDLMDRHPVGVGAVEFAYGNHYNHHPNDKTIGHWVVAYGYTDKGHTTKFADPATSVWGGVEQRFSRDTENFANNFLNNNGIVR